MTSAWLEFLISSNLSQLSQVTAHSFRIVSVQLQLPPLSLPLSQWGFALPIDRSATNRIGQMRIKHELQVTEARIKEIKFTGAGDDYEYNAVHGKIWRAVNQVDWR